ncbi:g1016 [Coccomyxa elongata]
MVDLLREVFGLDGGDQHDGFGFIVSGDSIFNGRVDVSGPLTGETVDDLKKRNESLQNQVEKLQAEMDAMKQSAHEESLRLDQCFFAPGMPGYLQARDTFSEIQQPRGQKRKRADSDIGIEHDPRK